MKARSLLPAILSLSVLCALAPLSPLANAADPPENWPPVVHVLATDLWAAEQGADPASYEIFRIGPTNEPLTVFFRIGGTARLPEAQPFTARTLDPPADRGTPQQIAAGGQLYGRYCGVCHGDSGIAGSLVPDLRYSGTLENADAWRRVVIDGALRENGMVSWSRVMNAEQSDSIRHFIIHRAHQDKALAGRTAAPPARYSCRSPPPTRGMSSWSRQSRMVCASLSARA